MPLIALPGLTELLLIFGVVVLLFGGKKLPQLGGAIGESIKNFKKGVKDDDKTLPAGDKKDDGKPT
jgi:sec-independent protein translocase protein TatA